MMAKKSLGQNFLFDPSILRRLVEVSNVTTSDTVVEIGPGHGSLTSILSGIAKKVIAIELDNDLFAKLQNRFGYAGNVVLIRGDALTYDYETLETFKVVANIPYYITTPIIFRLMGSGKAAQVNDVDNPERSCAEDNRRAEYKGLRRPVNIGAICGSPGIWIHYSARGLQTSS